MPAKKQEATARTGFLAIESFSTQIDGVDQSFSANETRVSAEWLDAHPGLAHLFQPMTFHYDVVAATANPGETRG